MSPPIWRMRATVCVFGIWSEPIVSGLEGVIRFAFTTKNEDAVSRLLKCHLRRPTTNRRKNRARAKMAIMELCQSRCVRNSTQPEPGRLVEQQGLEVDFQSWGSTEIGLWPAPVKQPQPIRPNMGLAVHFQRGLNIPCTANSRRLHLEHNVPSSLLSRPSSHSWRRRV